MTDIMAGNMLEHIALGFCVLLVAGIAAYHFWFRGDVVRRFSRNMHFTNLTEVAPAGLWRTDTDGQCIYVNAAWLAMAGISGDSWHGLGWGDAVHPDDRERVLSGWMNAVRNEEEYRVELRWQRPDGSTLWVMCLGTPEYGRDGDLIGYAGINIDIQRSKDLELELLEARKRAEREAQAKSTFLANMSHEIRTPMNGVIGFTELLLQADLTPEQKSKVQLIAESGRAMMQLLNDILDHSRIEAGQLQIVKEPADLRHKLEHCTKLIEPIARAKGLSVGIWIDDDVPQLVALDRLRVRQVLLNLIGNAVKFTETGGIDVEARVENSSDGQSILISVIDTGIGIEADRLEDIFTPFTQEDGSVARRYGGTGLGLAISSQLVTMMNGHITVNSKRGVGTQFTIRLPLIPVQEEVVAGGESDSDNPEPAFCLKGARVLVAEDHSINQQLIMAMSASLGLDVQIVEDGEKAVAAVVEAESKGMPFAAVLMDMQMPDVDGLEATRRLRAMGYDADKLPIIALTANCYPNDVADCKRAGMQSHLGKPITTVALARELSRWLGDEKADPEAPELKFERACSAKLITTGNTALAGLETRYRKRRQSLVEDMRRKLECAEEPVDWQTLTTELHKLAGVAANFGEPEIGEASRRLERELMGCERPEDRIAALQREWPHFAKAA